MQEFSDSSDSEQDIGRAVIIDFGSSTLRAGFSGRDKPTLIMPSVVGRTKTEGLQATGSASSATARAEDVLYGDEAMAKRDALKLSYPVNWGLILNWDDAHMMFKYVYEKLGSDMSSSPLVVMEGGHMNPKINREKITQMAFETFSVPYFYLASSSVATLGAAGRTTGLVIDVGEHVIRTIPVYEGYQLPHAVMKFDFGSALFTDSLSELLVQKGISLPPKDVVKDMKEKFAYVAQDFQHEKDTFDVSQEKPYDLPSGDVISLGTERFQCVEGIFKPSLLGLEMWGLHEHVVNTVRRCDPDIWQSLLGNVVLAGAGSLLPGLASRLQHEIEKELQKSDQRNLRVQVLAPPERDLLCWKGGSLLASFSCFPELCMSRDEYDEYGPNLVHRKCY